jgi:hypothetical protein
LRERDSGGSNNSETGHKIPAMKKMITRSAASSPSRIAQTTRAIAERGVMAATARTAEKRHGQNLNQARRNPSTAKGTAWAWSYNCAVVHAANYAQ